MNTPPQISKFWSSITITGFVSAIALAVSMRSQFEHEAVRKLPQDATPSKEVINPESAGNQPQINKDVPDSKICEQIDYYSDDGLDALNNTPDKTESIIKWNGSYSVYLNLKKKIADTHQSCSVSTPVAFTDDKIRAVKAKVFEIINDEYAVVNNPGADLNTRYEAWGRLNSFIKVNIAPTDDDALIPRADLFNHIGYTEESFDALGEQLARPLISAVIADVRAAMLKPSASFTEDQLKILLQKCIVAEKLEFPLFENDDPPKKKAEPESLKLRTDFDNWRDAVALEKWRKDHSQYDSDQPAPQYK